MALGTVVGGFVHIIQLSTDAVDAVPPYPEAVDLAFGSYAKYGTIKNGSVCQGAHIGFW